MSDEITQTEDQADIQGGDELAVLKQRARLMGVVFSNNIGLVALRQKIQERVEKGDEAPNPALPDGGQLANPQPNPLAGETPDTVARPRKTLRQHLIEEELKMIRVRITCMDPKKKELPGEIFTIANEHLGTVRKFIPFGEVTDEGYHVPMCLYRELESRRFLNIRVTKAANGREVVKHSWAKEFALEVLEPLSPAELERLATAQAAAGVFAE